MGVSVYMLEQTEQAGTGDRSEIAVTGKTKHRNTIGTPAVPPETRFVLEQEPATGKSHASPGSPLGTSSPRPSSHIVLPDESEEEWNQLVKDWNDAYRPQNALTRTLTMNAAVADWILKRAIKRYHQAEHSLFATQPNAAEWSAKQAAALDRLLRHKSTAERSFSQARNTVEQLRSRGALPSGTRHSVNAALSPARRESPATLLSTELSAETATPRAPGAIIQCVTVQILDGKTFTLFQPRNEYLQRMIESAREPKPTVKRALYFLHGVPEEYNWITESENHGDTSHFTIERTCREALEDLAREQTAKSRHVLPVR